ncbi:MAG: hypothetical protein ACXQS4_01615 [Methermicoccaceae archaeon]
MEYRNILTLRGHNFDDITFSWGGKDYSMILRSTDVNTLVNETEEPPLGTTAVSSNWQQSFVADFLYPIGHFEYIISGVAQGGIVCWYKSANNYNLNVYIKIIVKIVRINEDGAEDILGTFQSNDILVEVPDNTNRYYVAVPYYLTVSAEKIDVTERIAMRVELWCKRDVTDVTLETGLKITQNSDDISISLPTV